MALPTYEMDNGNALTSSVQSVIVLQAGVPKDIVSGLVSTNFTLTLSDNFMGFNGTTDFVIMPIDGVLGTAARTSFVKFRTTDASFDEDDMFGWGSGNSGGDEWRHGMEEGNFVLRVIGGSISFGTSLNDGAWHTTSVSTPASGGVSDATGYADGAFLSTGGGGGQVIQTATGPIKIARSIFNDTDLWTGDVEITIIFDRELTALEQASIDADPFQILKEVSAGDGGIDSESIDSLSISSSNIDSENI